MKHITSITSNVEKKVKKMNSKNEWWTKQRYKWLSKWRRDDGAVFGILDSRFRCQRGRTGGSKSSLSDWTLHTSIRNRGRLVKIRGSIFSKEWFKSEEGIVWLVSCATSVEDLSPPCCSRLSQEFDLLRGELAGTSSPPLPSSPLFSSTTNYNNNNRDVGCPGKASCCWWRAAGWTSIITKTKNNTKNTNININNNDNNNNNKNNNGVISHIRNVLSVQYRSLGATTTPPSEKATAPMTPTM